MGDTDPGPRQNFASEDEEAQYYLALLREGTRERKIEARSALARIFENRGMLEEATELLEGNARAGVRDRTLYTRLASLYRRQEREDLADQAMAQAASLMSPPRVPSEASRPAPTGRSRAVAASRAAGPAPERPPHSRRRGLPRTLGIGCVVCLGLLVLILGLGFVGGALSGRRDQTQATSQGTAAAEPGQGKPQQTVAPVAKVDGAKPQPPTPTPVPALPKVGETAEKGNWAVRLDKVETAKELSNVLGKRQAQGLFVILTYTLTNKSKQTSNLNSWDFTLKTRDGVSYRASSEGQVALSGDPPALIIAAEIQPGLSKQYRSVFDVNPDVKDYILEGAAINFDIRLP